MQAKNLKSIVALCLLALSLGLTSCNRNASAGSIEDTSSQPEASSTKKPSSTGTTPPSVTPTPTPSIALESSDEKFSKQIIGTWKSKQTTDSFSIVIEESFYPSNKFNITGVVTNSDNENIYVNVSGIWEINKGYLTYTISSSNVPKVIPVGTITANKIISMTDKDYVYVDKYGDRQIDRRMN